jgi:curved DNA-binding protein CbpA
VEKVSAPEPAAGPAVDCFALLREPRRPWLDPDALKTNFLTLAAQVHPDKVQAFSPAEKAAANERYAELNAAFHRLLDPKERLRHLLELASGAPLQDVQNVPPGAMDLLMAIGQTCRETDQFLAARAKTTSPLLKAQLFEAGFAWTEKLNALRRQIDARREALLVELKTLDAEWNPAAPPLARLEQTYRGLSFVARWAGQVQERLTQLSF